MMQQPLIVCSQEDIAGMNIKRRILQIKSWERMQIKTTGFKELYFNKELQSWVAQIEEPLVQSNHLDEYCKEQGIYPLCYIFASRHKSESAKPALLAHVTGNWTDDADLGGNPREICIASANLLRKAYLLLLEEKKKKTEELSDFSVNVEVTHHGPTNLKYPLLFVELGSNETYWNNEPGAYAIGRVILRLVSYLKQNNFDIDLPSKELLGVGIGFGGPHYASTFDRALRSIPIAFSHIMPKYAVEKVSKEIVSAMITRTIEKISWFILDWKGLNRAQKDVLIPILETFDSIPIRRAKRMIKEFEGN